MAKALTADASNIAGYSPISERVQSALCSFALVKLACTNSCIDQNGGTFSRRQAWKLAFDRSLSSNNAPLTSA